MFGGEVGQLLRRRGVSPQVHAGQRAGVLVDQLPGVLGVDVPGLLVDVAEDRGDALPQQGVRRRDEGEGRQHDLAAQPEGTDEHLQGDGGVAGGDGVPHPCGLSEAFLELLDQRAETRQPAAVERTPDAFHDPIGIEHVGAAHVQRFGEGGSAAQKGEFDGSTRHDGFTFGSAHGSAGTERGCVRPGGAPAAGAPAFRRRPATSGSWPGRPSAMSGSPPTPGL